MARLGASPVLLIFSPFTLQQVQLHQQRQLLLLDYPTTFTTTSSLLLHNILFSCLHPSSLEESATLQESYRVSLRFHGLHCLAIGYILITPCCLCQVKHACIISPVLKEFFVIICEYHQVECWLLLLLLLCVTLV